MALILSIDTSMENAAVCLANGTNIIAIKRNSNQTDHAAWIHTAIHAMLNETEKSTGDLAAVAVTSGPGSYTGLRVGMATAKGFCYALNIPLITESTLKLTAYRVKKEVGANSVYPLPILIAPMIDARRMEVFTSIYDLELQEMMTPGALILDESSYSKELQGNVIIFCGNGSEKWEAVIRHPNARFNAAKHDVADLAETASIKFEQGEFSELAYSEPAYLKNVYTGKHSN